jgi:hypothetical protein
MGPVEKATRAYIADLGELIGSEQALAAMATSTAVLIDATDDPRALPGLTKEMRLLIKQLTDGHTGGGDGEWDDMASTD